MRFSQKSRRGEMTLNNKRIFQYPYSGCPADFNLKEKIQRNVF